MSKSTIAIAEDGLPRTESVFRQADAALAASRVPVQAATSRDTAFDYLRAFITVLVVAHHSVIAYARISPDVGLRHPLHPWLAGIPIADSHRRRSLPLRPSAYREHRSAHVERTSASGGLLCDRHFRIGGGLSAVAGRL